MGSHLGDDGRGRTPITLPRERPRGVRFHPGALRNDVVIPLYDLPGLLGGAREERMRSGVTSGANLDVTEPRKLLNRAREFLPRIRVSRYPRPSTFSIVAFDPKTKDLGVAVESKFVAVGAVVPIAAARVGAIATQASANTAYGPKALAMLKRGVLPKDVVKRLLQSDKEAAQRQVGIVDARGRAASYTGKECFAWAGHMVGKNFAAQGNILAGADVVKAMAHSFEMTEGDLPVRLLAAMSAGQRAGGDKRGQQSAALLVVRERGGYGGFNDRWIDIRVDDHPAPIEELIRIFNVYDVTLLTREDPNDVVLLEPDAVREIQAGLTTLGLYRGLTTGKFDAKTKAAFEAWAEVNNYENKLRNDGKVWGSLFRALKTQVAAASA